MTQSNAMTLALDAMGGDSAPDIVIDGAALALKAHPELNFLIFGDEKQINPLLNSYAKLKAVTSVIHTDEKVESDEKPSIALRKSKQTSMRLAIDAVKDGRAQGVVSAGNTGALMAIAKIVLRTLPGISRPAIAGIIPNRKRIAVMLDLGANVECNANHLTEFAIMGDAFARSVLHRDNPSVALLNIGSEEMKGHEEIRDAAAMLRKNKDINFSGYIEGNGLLNDEIDVVVADGFTGNIALKTMEGTARFIYKVVSESAKSNILRKTCAMLSYPLLRSTVKDVKEKADPRRYNGAMFLGLNGIVIKTHGGTDAVGFKYAIDEAYELVVNNVNDKIVEELAKSEPKEAANSDAAPSEREVS